jgi:hypothetical protein
VSEASESGWYLQNGEHIRGVDASITADRLDALRHKQFHASRSIPPATTSCHAQTSYRLQRQPRIGRLAQEAEWESNNNRYSWVWIIKIYNADTSHSAPSKNSAPTPRPWLQETRLAKGSEKHSMFLSNNKFV